MPGWTSSAGSSSGSSPAPSRAGSSARAACRAASRRSSSASSGASSAAGSAASSGSARSRASSAPWSSRSSARSSSACPPRDRGRHADPSARAASASNADMAMKTTDCRSRPGRTRGLFDLTDACARFVAGEGDGLLNVFVPHATCGLVIMELGSGSDAGLREALDRVLPRDDRWRHRTARPARRRSRRAGVRTAVDQRACHRRAARARDVAVDRPRRHERRQRAADGPAVVPRGVTPNRAARARHANAR